MLVVGGGAVGLVSAYDLAQSGADVVLVDNDNPSASWAGAGILSPLPPWRYPETINKLAYEGAAAYPRLLTAIGDNCDYQCCGMLVLSPHEQSFNKWRGQMKPAAATPLKAGDVKEKIPLLSSPPPNAVFLPAVAQLRPPRLLKALRRFLHDSVGVRRMVTTVKKIITRNGVAVGAHLDNGNKITANNVVLTAGAWSGRLCPPPSPHIEPVCGQMLLFAPPPTLTLPCVVLRESDDFYLVQRPDGLLLAGSTATNIGFNSTISDTETMLLREKAQSLLPSLTAAPLRAWCGLRPKSADDLPLITQHPTIKNLFLNTTHFRYGLTMAPAAATLLTKLIHGDKLENPNPFAWTEDRRLSK